MSANTKTNDFLVEIGTEELPPTALLKLSNSFADQVLAGINAAELNFCSAERLLHLVVWPCWYLA